VSEPTDPDRDAGSFWRSRSFWLDTLAAADGGGDALVPRWSLPGDTDVDVAIVGAGYTGLWTAFELARRDPTMRIAVLEAEIAGFGASGRNGGWCSALLPMSTSSVAAAHGADAALALQRAMNDTVDEIGRVTAAEGIDCHFAKDGYLQAARNPAQVAMLQASVAHERELGLADQSRWLDQADARAIVDAAGTLGGVFTPHCAALHPARLARGLAVAAERRGVRIHEQTRALEIRPGAVRTDRGIVRAEVVVRATEGFTALLPGHHRRVVPIYSLMIATEPLDQDVWAEIGWSERTTFNDARRVVIYGQRTADDRIAFGGRGAPYHFGSAVRPAFDRDERTFAELRQVLATLFPALADVTITHQWGGPLAAARDWQPSVVFDRATGLASAGGYVGDGVATANLAGRTLADLITGADTERTRLPWVGHVSPEWEREPFRFLGIRAASTLPERIDRHEQRTGRTPERLARLLGRLTNH
jgi:glycine/D-amino acid oxidase-like deaminating enzyme